MTDSIGRFVRTIRHGLAGACRGFYSRRNITFAAFGAVLYIFTVTYLGLDIVSDAVIFISWLNVAVVEIINTGIEHFVDLINPDYNKVYGEIKDIMAGAVICAAIAAAIVTVMILWKPAAIKAGLMTVAGNSGKITAVYRAEDRKSF